MDQDQEGARPFPPPPPFYQHFTQSNTEQLEAVRRASQRNPPDVVGEKFGDVETHLQYLVPPKPPAATYNAFGEQHSNELDVLSLPEDVERLVPTDGDPSQQANNLIRLLRSVLLNFLELVGTLSIDADIAKSKVEDLRTLFFNAHDLLNRYRPHQARESLITLMEDQLRQKREEVAGVQSKKVKVDAYLSSLGSLEVGDSIMTSDLRSEDDSPRDRKDDQRRAWQALESIEV